jgi:putative transposase
MDNQHQLLTPFQRKLLLKQMQTEIRPEHRRRIEIMLLADTGASQTQICTQLGCSQDTARYWIKMAQEGQAHHWHTHPIGRPQTINQSYLERLKELVSHSPQTYGYPFKRWTASWLSKHLANEFEIEVSDRHINRLLKKMGRSTRDNPAKAEAAGAAPKAVEIEIRDLQPMALPDLLLINPIEVRP